ncbi:MAG TPA: hypothetical protein VHP37_16570 [Burkholderiales bacterium]|nr:hypothetical protein [Burkholderiales bacterium]
MDAHAASAPPAFKHTLLLAAQCALVTLACAAVGTFTVKPATNEYFGHLLPCALLAASAVLTMVGPSDARTLVRWEGRLAVVAGVAYILGDTFYSHPPLGILDNPGAAEQFHVGFMALIAAVGVFALLYVRALDRATGVHALILSAAFALFVTGHHQHGAASVLSHNASAVFALIAAAFRVAGRRAEYGICMLAAAYLFFSGQMSFAIFTDAHQIEGVAWVCAWTAAGVIVAAIYLAAFADAARRVG